MKQQFVITHTIRQIEIAALLDSLVKTYLMSKCCVHKNIACPHVFMKT
jgi:hypothetical protein